ncbi:hypothetical protein [Lonsdalea quercina]|uniref:hypothetical protein n=1 Tax=Lonsdalea quercina TaxID=71657 RepID=UPI003975BEA6
MHFKPVFLGVLFATSALSYTAANAAVESAHGNSVAPVITDPGRIEAASHDVGTHSAKKAEAGREAAKAHAESRQKAVQKKNNQLHEKAKTKKSTIAHHENKVNSFKEKQQELFPPKK